MKKIAFLAFVSSWMFSAFVAIAAESGPVQVSPEDQRGAYQGVLSIAKMGTALDADSRRRLLYQFCSELRGCARECSRELQFCAAPQSEPAQCAAVVASCAADYRQRRDQGEALHPDAWLKQRLVRFLDAVRVALPAAERRSFENARKQASLLVR